MLRQRSRPYLFSNSLPPMICAAGIELFKLLDESDELHDRQQENVNYFRDKMLAAGFDIKPTQSAICAVMLYRWISWYPSSSAVYGISIWTQSSSTRFIRSSRATKTALPIWQLSAISLTGFAMRPAARRFTVIIIPRVCREPSGPWIALPAAASLPVIRMRSWI